MRVLLRPVPVPELGLVVLKPGRESMQVFHNPRVLVEPEPKSMRGLPSGVVPAVRQPLVEDKSLLPFFSNERVIRAAGGASALSDWLLLHVKSCQWPHGDYHHSEIVIHRYGTGAMVLCWHCDNQLRDQTSESGEQTATSILKQRTKNIALPPHVHQQQNPPQEKTVVSIAVDPESPAQYLQRQKPQREEMPVYTRWVKTQKCMTCGNQADDPHHIIGHGLGGMGTKADDLLVIPLCRKCHNELHAGVKDFEEKHGSQLLLLIRFLMHARNSGVLKWKA
ncbi:DUF968 domain-containing protein [Escherichia coli]|uniref:DUF968 domain-containing protein n=1 Tax=Escherichia coli TaxID=562 RepID=UPI000246ED1F|nr:DUF968 domain-containing protein [Escherichia coli]EHN97145.1 hypothetical protein ESOG_04210 [Escherichia coli E101]